MLSWGSIAHAADDSHSPSPAQVLVQKPPGVSALGGRHIAGAVHSLLSMQAAPKTGDTSSGVHPLSITRVRIAARLAMRMLIGRLLRVCNRDLAAFALFPGLKLVCAHLFSGGQQCRKAASTLFCSPPSV